MKNTERLYNSIGGISENILSEALDYALSANKAKRRVVSVVWAALVIALSLLLAAFTYGDKILNAIFKRQTELIDNKSATMVASAANGDITVSIDKITADQTHSIPGVNTPFSTDIYVTFRNNNGVFNGGINFSGMKLEMLLIENAYSVGQSGDSYGPGEWCPLIDYRQGEEYDQGVAASNVAEALKAVDYGLGIESNSISIRISCSPSYYSDYIMTFYNVTSADGAIAYADELKLEFTLHEGDITPVNLLSMYTPENCVFELEGFEFAVKDIMMTPTHIQIRIENPAGDHYEFNGESYLALNYVMQPRDSGCFAVSDEINRICKENGIEYVNGSVAIPDQIGEELSQVYQGMAEYWDGVSVNEELIAAGYEMVIQINPECGSEIDEQYQFMNSNQVKGVYGVSHGAFFTSPVYVEDIERIYLRKVGDPGVEVDVWGPANDTSLASALAR